MLALRMIFQTLGLFSLIATLVLLASAQCTPHDTLTFLSPVTVGRGLVAVPIFANLTTPRGITFDPRQNLLVVERGLGITAFTSGDPSCNGWLRTIVIENANFTQGIQIDGNALYVSTSGQVLRYAYDASARAVSGSPVIIVDGIPPDGGMSRGAADLSNIELYFLQSLRLVLCYFIRLPTQQPSWSHVH